MSSKVKSPAKQKLITAGRFWFVIPLLGLFAAMVYLSRLFNSDLILNFATIPLEMIIGAILVDSYLERKEKEKRRRQLMFIKSVIFRSELRTLYLTNFAALEDPPITMSMLRDADLPQLKVFRKQAESIRYRSADAMEDVVMQYVEAYPVFYGFMEWAIANDFEKIFEDMVFVLHFIHDVKVFKLHQPTELYMHHAQTNPQLHSEAMQVLGTGICKFLEYVIELKQNQPETFDHLLADYEASSVLSGDRPEGLGFLNKSRVVFGSLSPN